MTFQQLKDRLVFYCNRDGILPPSSPDEQGRLINSAYRRLVVMSDFEYKTLSAIPPASTGYPLGRVAVSFSQVPYGVNRAWYPDTSRYNVLSEVNYEIRAGKFWLVDITTDGTSSLTVLGWWIPVPLAFSGDVPVIPDEAHESIVQEAFVQWSAPSATNAAVTARLAFYQNLVQESIKWLRKYNLAMNEREEYVPPEPWVSII